MPQCPICLQDASDDSSEKWYINYGCGHALHWQCLQSFISRPGSSVTVSQVGSYSYPRPIKIHNCIEAADAPYANGLIVSPRLVSELHRLLSTDSSIGAANNPGTRIQHFNQFINSHNGLQAYHYDAGRTPVEPLNLNLSGAILIDPKEKNIRLPLPVNPTFQSAMYQRPDTGIIAHLNHCLKSQGPYSWVHILLFPLFLLTCWLADCYTNPNSSESTQAAALPLMIISATGAISLILLVGHLELAHSNKEKLRWNSAPLI